MSAREYCDTDEEWKKHDEHWGRYYPGSLLAVNIDRLWERMEELDGRLEKTEKNAAESMRSIALSLALRPIDYECFCVDQALCRKAFSHWHRATRLVFAMRKRDTGTLNF